MPLRYFLDNLPKSKSLYQSAPIVKHWPLLIRSATDPGTPGPLSVPLDLHFMNDEIHHFLGIIFSRLRKSVIKDQDVKPGTKPFAFRTAVTPVSRMVQTSDNLELAPQCTGEAPLMLSRPGSAQFQAYILCVQILINQFQWLDHIIHWY